MSREEIEKLLGGYATGTLSEAERQRLFEAALEDPEIFALLAREQDFKDLLETPGAREELLAALASEPVPARAAAAAPAARPAPAPEKPNFWGWLTQPWPWAVAATAAFTAILFFALRPQPAPVETAAVVRPEPVKQAQEKPPERPRPVERAAAPAPKAESGARGPVQVPVPPAVPAAPPPAAVTTAAREVREEAKKAVAIASADKAKQDALRSVEGDRKAEAEALSAMAPPSPRKEMPPGATVQPPLRDDIARGGAPAPQAARTRANEAAPALKYRLAAPAFQAGREAEIFVTASRDGVLVVQRRAGEGWERILALRVRENQETRVSVPTRESDREVELDLSLADAVSLGSTAGFRRADRQETPQGLRVRIPRAQ